MMVRAASLVFGAVGLLLFACSGASGDSGSGGGGSGGGSAASGGTGGGIGLGGSAAGGNGGTGLGGGCATDTHDGELVPLDMFLMLDNSGSMQDGGKWGAVTGAINQFVGLPGTEGLAMGLGHFPIVPAAPPTCAVNTDCGAAGICFFGLCIANDVCEPTEYAKPVVGIAPLPGVGSQITAAIGQLGPSGGTPTRAALQGSMMYSMEWAKQHTDHITIVVLATDGEPSGCDPNSVSDVSAVAAQGLASNPSVLTFVVGVGSQLTSLNAVAQAGGTGQATIVSAGNAAQEFLDALNAIRGAVGCNYKLPIPPSGKPDPNKVNVAFTPDGGPQIIFPKVGGPGECQGKNGWYYDDPANPSQIILCPASCDLVTNTPGKVDVVLGCQSQVPE
jgi:hypothetical protein